MPAVFRPFVLPPSIQFYSNDESTLTQRVTVFNPYNFDILYKVDNARPQKYAISNRQGVITSRQKLYLDLACRGKEPSRDDSIQIRFFKWPKPCHGVKPRAQQYIGFREIKLCVYNDRSERERTPSQSSDVDMSVIGGGGPSGSQGMSSFGGGGGGGGSRSGSIPPSHLHHQQQHPERYFHGTGDCNSSVMDEAFAEDQHHRTQKLQVLMNLGVTVILLVMGFIVSRLDEDWFALNVVDGVKPHTIAVVCYTLGVVLLLKLLTTR